MKEFNTFLGLHELKTVRFYKALMCEFLATAILIICGCGGAVAMEAGKPPSTVAKAFTVGMTIAYIVWTFNHVSGTHFNPVVTFSFFINGHVSLIKAIGYITTQCVGAIAGAAVVWCLVPAAWRGNLGSTVFAEELTLAQGFAVELIGSFILLLGVFATSDRSRTDHAGSLPLSIGLMIFMESAWAQADWVQLEPSTQPWSCRGLWDLDNHWNTSVNTSTSIVDVLVYWTAPTIGGSVGSLLYKHVLAESPQGASQSIRVEARATSEGNVSFMSKFTDKVIIVEAGDRVNLAGGSVGNPV